MVNLERIISKMASDGDDLMEDRPGERAQPAGLFGPAPPEPWAKLWDDIHNSKEMVYCEKALVVLSKGSNALWAKDLDSERLLPALSFGINAKSPKGKKAAK